jgi:hypothetical protein
VLIFDAGHLLEQVFEASRQQSATVARLSLDSVGLAGSGLAVGEDAAIIAVEALVDDLLAYLLENLLLICFFFAHVVEGVRIS